jgi:hypothetical protein
VKKNYDPDIVRLCQSMQRARLVLRRVREERREIVRQYVGRHWAEEGTRERVPVNLIALYVSIVSRSLVPKCPRAMLSTFQQQFKPVVAAMQAWANKEIEDVRLENSLRRCVTDALFSIGIMKVALAAPDEAAGMGWNLRAGEPFAECVDLDDFIYDASHARDLSQSGFIGHRRRVPLEAVKDSKIYGKYRKDLSASNDPLINQEGDERVSVLGRGYYGDQEEFEDMIDLWEVYLPRHRIILTLAEDQLSGPTEKGSDEPLRVQRWLGPDTGPYHILSYGMVPGNAMPKAPLQDLIDLHEAVNRTYRKLIRTIDRIKENLLVESGATEDAQRIIDASDGEGVRVDRVDKLKQMVFSGQSLQNLLLVGPHLKEMFSWMAGNLEMMGGLSPQSKTLGQDKMLEENASRTVASLQQDTVNWTADVLKALCWYWYHDPFKVMETAHALEGLPGLEIQRQVGPTGSGLALRRDRPWAELEVKVDPYSMQHSTPQSRMAALNQVVQTILIPLMPVLQQQGIGFDVSAWLKKMAAYMDQPDLSDIITITAPPEGEAPSSGGEGPKPAETTRNYVRENRPERTQQGNDMLLRNSLMGVNSGGNPNQRNGSPMGVGA